MDRLLSRIPSTAAGLMAIAFWSTSVAFSRDLAQQMGVFSASAAIYLPAGVLGTAMLLPGGRLRHALTLPKEYLFGCGALFAVYLVGFTLAVGLCRTPAQVVEVGLINYLWPALTLVLSIPLQGNRARAWLPAGMVVAIAGVLLASHAAAPTESSRVVDAWSSLRSNIASNPLPYALCVLQIAAWALYSNLAGRLAPGASGEAVPLFVLASGALLAIARMSASESGGLDATGLAELAFMALFPGLLAYLFWERAMRGPGMVLVASLSYLIPLFSTLLTCAMQDIALSASMFAACGLVVGGAALCRLGVRPAPRGEASTRPDSPGVAGGCDVENRTVTASDPGGVR